jgi:hypothetical protein
MEERHGVIKFQRTVVAACLTAGLPVVTNRLSLGKPTAVS